MNTPTTTIRAFSYLRFSTPEQERGDSFRRQTALADAWCLKHGVELDSRSYRDLGVSAFRGANAKTGMLGEFIRAVEEGMIPVGSYLLIESLDRLSRATPMKAMNLLQRVCEAGVTLVTLTDGKVYTEETLEKDPMSFLWAVMVAIRANEESEMKSRRLDAVWEAKRVKAAETGSVMTSKAPAWLIRKDSGGRDDRFEPIPERAEVVKRIFQLALDGVDGGSPLGLDGTASLFNKEGVPTFGRAQHWHKTYVRKILENPAVVGTLVPHREDYVEIRGSAGKKVRVPLEPITGYYPAVVDQETFDRVQASRGARRVKTTSSHAGPATPSHLLAGLAKCPQCGSTMTRVNKGGKRGVPSIPKLVCTRAKTGAGCDYRSVPVQQVEDALIGGIGFLVAGAPLGGDAQEVEQELMKVEANLYGVDEAIQNVLEAIQAGGKAVALVDRLRALENERDSLEAQRKALITKAVEQSSPVLLKRLEELADAIGRVPLDKIKGNLAIRAVVDRVVVDYRTGELEVCWRSGGESRLVYAWAEG